ncbi:MAG: tetratricopeptide repeat protein [bacterium]|nr:tetratricopeptide repeat protein [bacterium]
MERSTNSRPTDDAFVHDYNRAVELGEAGDIRGAIALTRSLCTRYPTDAAAWSHLSALLIRQKDYHGALAAAQDALARDPEHSGAHINAGVAARGLGDLETARRHIEEAVRIAPSDPDAHLQLGGTLVRLHQWRTAVDAFVRAIAEAHHDEGRSEFLIERGIDGLTTVKLSTPLAEPLRSLHDGARWLKTGDLVPAYQRLDRARDAASDDETVRRAAEALLGHVWRQRALTTPTDPNDDRDQHRDNVLYL